MSKPSAFAEDNHHLFQTLGWQDHVCMVFDDAVEWGAAVGRFLQAGPVSGTGCLCLMPEDFFDGNLSPVTEGGQAACRALQEGRLVHWYDPARLEQAMRRGVGTALAAGAENIADWSGGLVVCDMTWLRACGFPEKLRLNLLKWLRSGWRDERLLVLSGYRRGDTSDDELRHAIGGHRYLCHAGQLLPGGFRWRPAPDRTGESARPDAGWRRIFRRGQVLEAVFEALPFAVWMLDAHGILVYLNGHTCGILGGREAQLLGCKASELGSSGPDASDAVRLLGDPGNLVTTGLRESELQVLHGDGYLCDLQVIHSPVLGEDGRPQGLLGLAMDVTGYRKAERLLKESEERFRDIALSIGELIWEVDATWHFTYLSECADRVLGRDAGEMVGKSLFEIGHGATADTWQVLLDQWRAEPLPFRNMEKWLHLPHGNSRCLLLSGVPVFGRDGGFRGFRGVAEDITGRKQQEASLKGALWEAEDARDKIDNILRSISEALVVVDDAGRIVMFNARAESLFGISTQQAVGRPFIELCPDGEACGDLLRRLASGETEVGEACLSWSAGAKPAPAFFKARASRLVNVHGQRGGAIVIFQDMTREREMERVKTEFISTAAHELRTPLTSIMGYLEFCMHPEEFGGFPEAQLKEFMAEIYDKAEVLERIVSDLLDISRMEAGRDIPLVIETVDVEAVTRKILQHFQLQFPRYRFEMEFSAETGHQVQADREKLVQVMENLVSNAVKYSAAGSTVRVQGACEASRYRISVLDQGIGMTPAQIERMFERFYRAVDVNSGVRGLGLGMHIVKHIIERHGGSIEVASAPRQGTEIVFSLPLGP